MKHKLLLALLVLFSTILGSKESFAAVHTYVGSDWNALTDSSVIGDNVIFENNGSYSIAQSNAFPLGTGTYYIRFSSFGTTGNIQFQNTVGEGHTIKGYNNTNEEFTMELSTMGQDLQVAGGSTNWVSETDATITYICISDVSLDECEFGPTPPGP